MNPYIFAYIAFAAIMVIIAGKILISANGRQQKKNLERLHLDIVGNVIPALEESFTEIMRTSMDEIPDRLKDIRKEMEGSGDRWAR